MNRLFRNSIGYGAYGENFGDGVPPACVAAAQAVGDAGVEMQRAQIPPAPGFPPDATRIYNAQLDHNNKQQALQSCISSNSGITAGDVATGVQTGVGVASIFTPLALLFLKKPTPKQTPGQPTVIVQGGGPAANNTPIIIAAVAGVAVLLVVVMMMQKK